jgi:hypothetical protein
MLHEEEREIASSARDDSYLSHSNASGSFVFYLHLRSTLSIDYLSTK